MECTFWNHVFIGLIGAATYAFLHFGYAFFRKETKIGKDLKESGEHLKSCRELHEQLKKEVAEATQILNVAKNLFKR